MLASYPTRKLETATTYVPEHASDGSPCICVVDDDASLLKALGRLLTAAGFKVKMFNDPVAYLAATVSGRCTLAILDVWMPDMNGLEVQAVLNKESPNTRIILMSGRDDPPVREAALEAGAFAFLTKPFDDEDLVQLVQEAIAA